MATSLTVIINYHNVLVYNGGKQCEKNINPVRQSSGYPDSLCYLLLDKCLSIYNNIANVFLVMM